MVQNAVMRIQLFYLTYLPEHIIYFPIPHAVIHIMVKLAFFRKQRTSNLFWLKTERFDNFANLLGFNANL